MPGYLRSKLRAYAALMAAAAASLLILVGVPAALEALSPVSAVELTIASQPLLPVSSPTALVGVDTGTNQAYVRVISVDVQQGVLQGATATIYFPAAGLKAFLVEFYAFDSQGTQIDYTATVGLTGANTYTATVTFTGGVQAIDAAQVEVRVTCLLGC